MGNFQTLPALRNYGRALTTQVIKQFRGLNIYTPITNTSPEWATDLLNVIVNNSGGLSKFRLPVAFGPPALNLNPPFIGKFYDFQQANGTRQILIQNGRTLYYSPAPGYALNTIGSSVNYQALFSIVTSNNIAFLANNVVMQKWLGSGSAETWGIPAPANPPKIGVTINLSSIQRASNVVTAIAPFTVQGNSFEPIIGDSVLIAGVSDSSFDGQFAIVSTVPGGITFNQTGANAGPIANSGTITIFHYQTGVAKAQATQRSSGIATVVLTSSAIPSITAGMQVILAGFTDTTFNGTFTVNTWSPSTLTILQNLPDAAFDNVAGDMGSVSFGNSTNGQLLWGFAYGNSVTGHISSMSPPTGVVSSFYQDNVGYFLTADTSSGIDAQVDTIYWYRTYQNGANWYFDHSDVIANTVLFDPYADVDLDAAVQAQFINGVPPIGKYLSQWQNRIFIFNLLGNPQAIAYTGLERILQGRPEESVPPFNKLLLQIGANAIAGGGVIQAGVVAFDVDKKMYMFRGVVEDIITNAPLLISAYLEELPWQIGSISHECITSTPYGLVWWASDHSVQVFNGTDKPTVISTAITALLKSATAGYESTARGRYFNWLDREWYVLTFARGGATNNNTIAFFDLNPDPNSNFGIFISDIEADNIETVDDINGRRHLIISTGGALFEVIAETDVTLGMSGVFGIGGMPPNMPQAATSGILRAYWESWWGNETPQTRKMFRFGNLVTDCDGFQLTAKLVDMRAHPFTNPKIIRPKMNGSDFAVNWKAKRCGLRIDFPYQDQSANVLELTYSYRDSGDK